MIYFYLTTFLLTLCGFLLQKSTKEEIIEIFKYIHFTKIALFLVTNLLLVILIQNKYLTVFLAIFSVSTLYYFNYDQVREFSFVTLLSISFFLFQNSSIPHLITLPIFVLVLENSIKKFNLKSQIYSFIYFTIMYFLLSQLV